MKPTIFHGNLDEVIDSLLKNSTELPLQTNGIVIEKNYTVPTFLRDRTAELYGHI